LPGNVHADLKMGGGFLKSAEAESFVIASQLLAFKRRRRASAVAAS
jgi:hypothetical protein